ncbi:MAG: hypothetical protein AAGK93_00115 [Pseudomonadota bacterium]
MGLKSVLTSASAAVLVSVLGSAEAGASLPPENHTDGLISEWLFDEGAGNTVADSVGSNDVDLTATSAQSFTWQSWGAQFTGGAFVTPLMGTVKTIAALIRVPNQSSGGFIVAGGTAANQGIVQGFGYTSGTAHVGGGFGVHPLKQRSPSASNECYEPTGGGWLLIFMEPSGTIDTAYALGGRASTSLTSNRCAELDVVAMWAWDKSLTDANKAENYAFAAYVARQRGVYLRSIDCPVQRNAIVLLGDSLAEGRSLISGLSTGDQNQVFDNVWISVTDNNNVPDFYPPPVFDLGVNQTTSSPAGQFGHELGMAQAAEAAGTDLVIIKGSLGGSHFAPVDSNGAGDPSVTQTWYPETTQSTLFARLLGNFYWTEQYFRNQGIGLSITGLHIDGGLNDATNVNYSGASGTVYQGHYQDLKDEFETYTNVSGYRVSMTLCHNNDPASDATALARIRSGQTAFATALGASVAQLINIDSATFPDNVHPGPSDALATGDTAYEWLVNGVAA